MGVYEDLPSHLPSDDPDRFLCKEPEPYEIVFDSWHEPNEEAVEQALAVAMTLTAQDFDNLAKGMSVSKTIPKCFRFKYRVQVDSDGVVWIEEQR